MKIGKGKSLGQSLIDLTPLLDVIFIILIVVLCNQKKYNDEADIIVDNMHEEVSAAHDEAADATATSETYKEQLGAYADLEDYVNVVTIYASYTPSNRKFRKIHVVINTDEEKVFDLNPSNTNKAWDDCRKYVEEVILQDTSVPAIISVKNEKMLYRDEQQIISMVSQFNGDNVYLRSNSEALDE